MKEKLFALKYPPLKAVGHNSMAAVIALSDHPVIIDLKDKIQNWYDHLPHETKDDIERRKDIKGRIESRDDGQHNATLFELMFDYYFRHDGWIVEPNYRIGNKKIDFKLTGGKSKEIFLEVLTISERKTTERKNRQWSLLCERFDGVKSNYHYTINVDRWAVMEDAELMKLIDRVIKWKMALHVRGEKDIRQDFDSEKYAFNIRAQYDPTIADFFSQIGPGGHADLKRDIVKDRLGKKIKKYNSIRDTDIPLVIAVCNPCLKSFEIEGVEMALYGKKMLAWNIGDKSSAKTVYDNSGYFYHGATTEQGVNNRVVTAVFFCGISPTFKRFDIKTRLFKNPNRQNPLSGNPFRRIEQML